METTPGGDISTYKKFDRVAPVELNSEVPPVVTLADAYGVGEILIVNSYGLYPNILRRVDL